MLGLMQQQPLMISSLLQFAARHHGNAEIVSNTQEGGRHSYTYRDAEGRARRLAAALDRLGVQVGDRVGTLAWNGYRHLELYFAVPGMGAVLHTINPRPFEDQIAYIIDDAEDRVLFAEPGLVPLVERVIGRLRRPPEAVVVLADHANLPAASLPDGVALYAYEDLLDTAQDGLAWPELDENRASGLCYTSGTTGHPKGVLYSHRSTVLQSLTCSLPVVAMFHVDGWCLPYAATMGGEWISSIELENVAMSHPDVAESAVIAARHPRWDERPLLLVVPRAGCEPRAEELLAWCQGRVASWSVPDAAVLVGELPHTATGKLLKTALRERYGDYYLRET